MYPPPALAKGVRGGGGDRWKKNMALGARSQKLLGGGGVLLSWWAQRDRGELNSQRRLDLQGLAAMFFCKRDISVATLLLLFKSR